jgi:radical SAM superfamily enzyme YgiQ (UPF0313 family)
LRLTHNCPWNKCAFCPVYKGEKFSFRSVDEIKGDIDAIAMCRDLINDQRLNHPIDTMQDFASFAQEHSISLRHLEMVLFWMSNGMTNLFLQDADSLVMKTHDLIEVLSHIKDKFPSVKRITSYSRAKTLSSKKVEDLVDLHDHGINRLHVGMESGSDEVLTMIKKGASSEQQIDGGLKAMKAGFEVSQFYMPGLGGEELWEKNAIESAKVINAVNPHFVRIRSTIPVPGTPLHEMMQQGQWKNLSEEKKIKEIHLFISSLSGITSTITSDHIMNLLEDIKGTLPKDKEKMLGKLDKFLSMNKDDKDYFIIGRRMGIFQSLDSYRPIDDVKKITKQIKEKNLSVDEAAMEMLWNYI